MRKGLLSAEGPRCESVLERAVRRKGRRSQSAVADRAIPACIPGKTTSRTIASKKKKRREKEKMAALPPFNPLMMMGGMAQQQQQQYPICYHCKQLITVPYLIAFGQAWHKEHLACKVCRKDFSGTAVVREGPDGYAYCDPCAQVAFAPVCFGCKEQILSGDILTANETKVWIHSDSVAASFSPKLTFLQSFISYLLSSVFLSPVASRTFLLC